MIFSPFLAQEGLVQLVFESVRFSCVMMALLIALSLMTSKQPRVTPTAVRLRAALLSGVTLTAFLPSVIIHYTPFQIIPEVDPYIGIASVHLLFLLLTITLQAMSVVPRITVVASFCIYLTPMAFTAILTAYGAV